MTRRGPTAELAPREREIFDVVFRLRRATAEEIRAELDDPPSNSSVRKMLGLLEQKGFVQHVAEGVRYVYQPAVDRAATRRHALGHVIRTFFGDSPESLVTTLMRDHRFSADQLQRMHALIREAALAEQRSDEEPRTRS